MSLCRSTCWTCSAACGVLVTVQDGKAVKIEGDPEHPRTKGTLCAKGLASLQLQYHPDRLLYPMRRVGARGQGQWQRITWPEAIQILAGRLAAVRQQWGPEAVAVVAGGSRPVLNYSRRFANALGTPNHGAASHLCSRPSGSVSRSIVGAGLEYDVTRSRCIVCMGSNWLHTQWAQHLYAVEFMAARKNGALAITVDPRLSMTGARSDIWLQVRPGSDAALLLAWINVIIEEGLYDRDFVANWTTGFPELAAHSQQFTPEWAEQVTWIRADRIRETARLYATTKPACITVGVALEETIGTTGALQALTVLAAITGSVDVDGGNTIESGVLPASQLSKVMGSDLMPRSAPVKGLQSFPLIPDARPGFAIWESIVTGQPYQVKAVLVHGGNPVLTNENARNLVFKALEQVDFLAVADLFPTPTSDLADLVLPAATWLEKDDLNYRGNVVSASPKLVEPQGEARNDVDMFIDILKAMGLTYGANSQREFMDWLLAPLGKTYEDVLAAGYLVQPQVRKKYEKGLLRADGKPGFDTPSGKVELLCSRFAKLGLDPLPQYHEPAESPYSTPELLKQFPLVLTDGGRKPMYHHSQHRQVPWLRQLSPEPELEINRQTAADLGIADGDWVWIEGVRGRCRQRAKLTNCISPRVVHAEFGWWYPETTAPAEALHGAWVSNINMLTDQQPNDKGCGSTPVRALLCKVYKCSEEDLR